ncbi:MULTISPECIES: hypothetical protein [Flavobacterium]|uniref:Signal peptidase n=1 Tax=Flavobacterium algoritolerans TaxID=3041254 RepID=A0ABT6VFJ8_9FLAO|nr:MULTISPECIES: hypothetical protein [Flavobacterium]MDI5887258.1 hypothetical protein [Flavobacterium yafengii]MDI5896238.1 hypothetical protein [Flavobacterium algoritolerans]
MKNILLKLYCTLFCTLSSVMLFAQAGDDTPTGDLENTDAPAAPINGKLFVLAIAGIIFAYYTFKKYRKIQGI